MGKDSLEFVRPTWNEYFLEIAEVVSKRASCPRASSGCILVDNGTKRILATGYNGAPSGTPSCLEIGCEVNGIHCVRANHGEYNTIEYADKYNVDYENTTLYEYYQAVSDQSQTNYYPKKSEIVLLDEFPCLKCKNLMLQKGIGCVICKYGNGFIVKYNKGDVTW